MTLSFTTKRKARKSERCISNTLGYTERSLRLVNLTLTVHGKLICNLSGLIPVVGELLRNQPLERKPLERKPLKDAKIGYLEIASIRLGHIDPG